LIVREKNWEIFQFKDMQVI